MKIYLAILISTCVVLLAACGAEKKPEQAMPNFTIVTNLNQTMFWVLDPAADKIWDSAGTVITAEGERDLSPTTDEGWDEVVHSAATLAESGNLLMLPGRSMGADWDDYAMRLTATSKLALKAAQDHDKTALFDAGGEIYQVCLACHLQYAVGLTN